ncbi:MAG: peptidoglycan DD-metalloendopeptidase family protein [Geminicoccaceae bacterium]
MAILLTVSVPARVVDAALVGPGEARSPDIRLHVARLELEHWQRLARVGGEKFAAARSERLELERNREAMVDSVARLDDLRMALQGDLQILALEQAENRSRLGDIDEALKAASVALVRQERQASAGDRDERTLGLKAWIATLGTRRKTARLQADAMSAEIGQMQMRLERLDRAREALLPAIKGIEAELQSLLALRHFRDLVRDREASRVGLAEERLEKLRHEMVIAAGQERQRTRSSASNATGAGKAAEGGNLVADGDGSGRHVVGLAEEERDENSRRVAAGLGADGSSASYGAGRSMQLDALPLQGEILVGFGDREGEHTSNGITIASAADTEIVAPVGGKVVFAGPFKDYGLLLIIDHGNEYHTLLTGFGEIGPEEGDVVRAGQMVGRLAERVDNNPRLYLELRFRGMPVNPLPWLAARSDKVRG